MTTPRSGTAVTLLMTPTGPYWLIFPVLGPTRPACADLDPNWFFPDDLLGVRRAKEICTGCGVRAACLEEALADRRLTGVWGGTTGTERRRLRRSRRGVPKQRDSREESCAA
jgi:WhiB family transcriptional regulator, redox-sensing transcriptional regulator